MFTTKQAQLIDVKPKARKGSNKRNAFLHGASKVSAETLSGNGALKYSTTGSDFVDQFGNLGTYKAPRSFDLISSDCAKLYAKDKELFVKFTIYMRMISRKTDIVSLGIKTLEAQSGAELRHEGIMRMVWLSQKDPEAFWSNIGLFISAGSCKDIITMLRQDLVYHGWEGRKLDWDKFGALIVELLSNDTTVNLMKKYLPQIRSNSSCTTVEKQAGNIIAKWICNLVFGSKSGSKTYKQYRQLKNSGTAHEWQKLISQQKFSELDFKAIHGRALNLLVRSKFLKNQNLSEAYSEWVNDKETVSVKYTGFVHELLCELDSNRDPNFVTTVDKQFVEAVNKVKGERENATGMIVVRDTSGSMGAIATGCKFTCNSVAKALALYFSEFLSGEFADSWIEFNNTAKMHTWKGQTASERWRNDRSGYVGGTNFQSVIDLFTRLKAQGIDEADFPVGIVCISDGEFNPAQLGKTNVEVARQKLRNAGFSNEYCDNFKICLWNLYNSYYGQTSKQKFETFGDVKNVFYLSGYSASNVQFILNNKVETAEDLFNAAMDQELLSLVKV